MRNRTYPEEPLKEGNAFSQSFPPSAGTCTVLGMSIPPIALGSLQKRGSLVKFQ